MSSAPAEFMRFTAPDPEALLRSIEVTRGDLKAAEASQNELSVVECAAELASMLTAARMEVAGAEVLSKHEAVADAHPEAEASAWFWNAYATALQYMGQRTRADGYFGKALAAARTGGWKRVEGLILHHWGRSLVEQGRFAEAETQIAQALAMREELNEPRQESSRQALAAVKKLRAVRVAGDA